MKKALAFVLALVLAVSCSCVIFASAEGSVNLAKGVKPTNLKGEALKGAKYGGQWPADYTADLTDGKAEDHLTFSNQWFAFYYNATNDGKLAEGVNADLVGDQKIGTAVLDLGETCTIDKVSINLFTGNSAGIVPPKSVKVETSEDGKTYTELQTKTFTAPVCEKGPDGKDVPIDKVEKVDFAGKTAATGRYVRVSVVLGGIFSFLNEIEVLGVKGANQPIPDESSAADEAAKYTEEIAAKVKANENAKGKVKLDSKLEDGKVIVTVTLDEAAADAQTMLGFQATLYYDADKVELDKSEAVNTGNAVGKVTKAPAGWVKEDYMTKHSTTVANAIDITIGTTETTNAITKDAPLVLTFTFKLKADATAAGFWIDTDSVKTLNGDMDPNTDTFEGAYTVAKVATAPVETSSEAESSSKAPVAPKPGDSGIIVFTILGIIAVAGAAVVVKARH